MDKLTLFIAITSAAVLLQMFILAGMFFTMRASSSRMLLERGKLSLQYFYGRILPSRINVVAALRRMSCNERVEIRKGEQRGLHDRGSHWLDTRLACWVIFEAGANIIGIYHHQR